MFRINQLPGNLSGMSQILAAYIQARTDIASFVVYASELSKDKHDQSRGYSRNLEHAERNLLCAVL